MDHQDQEEEEELYNYADIFDVLSNIELLHPNLPTQQHEEVPFINNIISSSGCRSRQVHDPPPPLKPQNNLEKGETIHDPNPKSHVPEITPPDPQPHNYDEENIPNPRDSKRSRGDIIDHQPRRSRSSELHNMSERIRRDRIRRKMKALQDLIPNCSTRDKASMLDDAIRYIKALQNQLKTMSAGAGSTIQAPNMLPAGYQMVQFPPQFMPMSPGIGMSMGLMLNLAPSTSIPVMPFALPAPLVASGMTNMVGSMVQPQAPLHNPFQSVSSVDSALMAAPESFRSFPSTVVCATHIGESSSQNVPRTLESSQVPMMSQGTVSAMVLPSQIITPASSSSTSVVTDVPEIPEEDNDSDSSQRI